MSKKLFDLARINSTQTMIGAQSLWKKVRYCCLNYNIYYNSGSNYLHYVCKSSEREEEEEAITNAI
jgi:hypothetical protein